MEGLPKETDKAEFRTHSGLPASLCLNQSFKPKTWEEEEGKMEDGVKRISHMARSTKPKSA
jgi:hypothetical protein